jgi:hypothetical protein
MVLLLPNTIREISKFVQVDRALDQEVTAAANNLKIQFYLIKTLLLGMFIFVAKAEVHMIETGSKKTDNTGEEYFSSRYTSLFMPLLKGAQSTTAVKLPDIQSQTQLPNRK